jgi:hypothetical protein
MQKGTIIQASFGLQEILEEKKNELSPHSRIPPPKFLQSKGGLNNYLFSLQNFLQSKGALKVWLSRNGLRVTPNAWPVSFNHSSELFLPPLPPPPPPPVPCPLLLLPPPPLRPHPWLRQRRRLTAPPPTAEPTRHTTTRCRADHHPPTSSTSGPAAEPTAQDPSSGCRHRQ